MNYADIKYYDIANGPGCRISIFVSGCEHKCPECFNEEAWDFNYGKPFTYVELLKVSDMLRKPEISGLTFLGGEPMHPRNVFGVALMMRSLVPIVKELDKTIWLYSGYTIDELHARLHDYDTMVEITSATKYILNNIDVLVDGRFDRNLKSLSLKFRGSSNQRIIDMKKSVLGGYNYIHPYNLEGDN